MRGTGLEIDVKLLPPPTSVDRGLRAALKDIISVRKQLDEFVDGPKRVPDFKSLALQLEWAGATMERCRLALRRDQLAEEISMLARFRRSWPIIKDAISYIFRGK